MAEYVHQTLEEMIPELEDMNQLGIFTVKETKIILKNREKFEYKLRQVTKTKASYLVYIQYEKKLLELLKIRRKKIATDSKKREIEKSIADRIHHLYRLVTTRFPEDVSLWEGHIDFSKALNEKAYVSRLYTKALKLHSHNEDLWVQSARWERSQDGNNNHELAREILLKAQRVNPESQLIFLEMYLMELELGKQILKRKSILGLPIKELSKGKTGDEDDTPSEFKLAEIVYRKGLELFPGNTEFHMKLLAICCAFKGAKNLQNLIVSDLRRLYPDTPRVWNGLALMHLNALKKLSRNHKKLAVKQCFHIFNEAIKRIPGEEMWSYCLEAYLYLIDLMGPKDRQWLLEPALAQFDDAIEQATLSESLYTKLLGLLREVSSPEQVSRVAEKGVGHHPASASLWLDRLKVMGHAQGDGEAVAKALKVALKTVPAEESWPLWEFVLTLLASRQSPCLEELMERACRMSTTQVSLPAKEWSLAWTLRQGGIKKARNAYTRLKIMRPISLQFYRLYIQTESSQEEPKLKLIRQAFEEALVEFGLNEPDLWLNYMEMERVVANNAARSGVIQHRAMSGLDPHLKESFIRKQIMAGLGA